jgi:hypothetical protein
VIDTERERLYALSTARRWFPRRRGGKRPSLQTMYRWSSVGYHGVVLETVQVGSTRCTTREACSRFVQRVSGLTPRPADTPASGRPKPVQQVDEALRETGFDRRPSGPRARSARVDKVFEGAPIPRQVSGSEAVTPETGEHDKEGKG